MGKKDENQINDKERVESVLHLLKKQAPLTLKQEKFCNNGCVERFLKAKGDNVKKAAKLLRTCLSWRDSFPIDHLIADEFCAELSEGMAYIAGHDHQLRPVLIFRIKQDYQKFHSQKLFTRLLVFTLEVAVQAMPKNVQQFVLLFDACFFRSASSFMNVLVPTLKIIADYYPQQLHKAFVIDPPSLFSYLWKGVRPFVDLSQSTVMIISSLEFDDVAPSFSSSTSARLGSCSSSRFAFTVSHHHFDSMKPWYLSLKDTSASEWGPRISPSNARSFSFASSPATWTSRGNTSVCRNGFFPSTLMSEKRKLSFFRSPVLFFRKDHQLSRSERANESFAPFLRLYEMPYDEMVYRSKMRPPLGGLISIVSPQLKRRHMSISQRF